MHELTTAIIKILITGIFFTRSSTNTARTTATVTALVSHICRKFKDQII
jgi:di/tricarboxylate transporter